MHQSLNDLLSLLCLSATGRRNSMSPDRNNISNDSDDDTSDEGQVIITMIDDVYDIRICNLGVLVTYVSPLYRSFT